MSHRVLANKGFISGEMGELAAYRYGYLLKNLGNVGVKVVPSDRVKSKKAWREL